MSERVTTNDRVVADGVNVKQAALLYCRLVVAGEPALWTSGDDAAPTTVAEYVPGERSAHGLAGQPRFSVPCYFYGLGQIEAFEGLHFLDGTAAALTFAQLPDSSPTLESWLAFEKDLKGRMEEPR